MADALSEERVLAPSIGGGRYRVLGPLGRGGAAEVLRVRDQATGKELALKRLRADRKRKSRASSPDKPRAGEEGRIPSARDSQQRSEKGRSRDELRFRREFHVLAGLAHPNIIEVYDFGVDESGPYYTMELLDGQELHAIAPVPAVEACRLLRDVASALALLHARRLIHRDVSPRNVWRTSSGKVKLTDFGVLATMGLAREVAGTPPCIPPECVHRLPLDQRVDLFALGSLGYWLLTRKVPYPARAIRDLDTVWRNRPMPLSALAPAVPQALEELIHSMLSLDPLGRPASASEVIDRLTAIAELPPIPRLENVKGHLVSASMVGRRRELAELSSIAELAAKGSGGAAVLEAPSGMGKSRLVREASLEAKLRGCATLFADAGHASKGPYGVVRELARAAITELGDDALEAMRPHVAVLLRVLPLLKDRYGGVRPAALSHDPAEDRALVQTALISFFLDLAHRKPLAIFVDDLQRSDEASASTLAALARKAALHPIAIIAALRTDEPTRAKGAVELVSEAGVRQRLRGLELRHVERLVVTLFGDVPNAARLARAMHLAASGSPLSCVEIARHLVDIGSIEYVDGTFVLPDEVKQADLPATLAAALDSRVRALPPAAFAFAQALALCEGEIPLQLAVAVAKGDEPRAFDALDELVAHDVLVGDRAAYSFRHDGVREALLRSIPEDARPSMHIDIARALIDVDGKKLKPEKEGPVGFHLLHGGEIERGAVLLASAGQRFYDSQSFADSIPPLEAALAAYEKVGRPIAERIALQLSLVSAGTMCDRDVLLKYAEPTIAELEVHSGLTRARKLIPWLGRPLGLAIGMATTWIVRLFARSRDRGPRPTVAMRELLTVVAYAASAFSLSFDVDRAHALLRIFDPLSFMRTKIIAGARLLIENFWLLTLGRWHEARRNGFQILELLEATPSSDLSEADRVHAQGAALQMIAAVDAINGGPECIVEIERLEALGRRFFTAGALTQRAIYHRFRGEEDLARDAEQSAESIVVELGAVWVHDAQQVWLTSIAYGLTRDLVGLRRSIEGLSRLCATGYRMQPFLDLARGEYRRERGELDAARICIERALAGIPEGSGLLVSPGLCALAETVLAMGDAREAAELARQAHVAARDPRFGRDLWRWRAGRVLSLAEAQLGDVVRARKRLAEMIEESAPLAWPSIGGALHEASARIALLEGDMPAFERHCAAAEDLFKGARNPALVARIERLRSARREGATAEPLTIDPITVRGRTRPSVARAIAACTSSGERAAKALEIAIDAAGADAGHLYLAHGRTLVHVAPERRKEPPDAVYDRLERAVLAVREGDEEGSTDATVVEGDEGAYHVFVLATRKGEGGSPGTCIGAFALLGGAVHGLDRALIDELVIALREDAVTIESR